MLTRYEWQPGKALPTEPRAVALGVFDGLHRGHAAVISSASAPGRVPCVLRLTGVPKRDAFRLLTDEQDERLLETMGVREWIDVPFSTVRNMSPKEFIQDVLKDSLHTRLVACGFNFHFGHGASADAAQLKALALQEGMACHVIPAVYEGGEPISATRIRRLLESGEPAAAAVLLGRAFSIEVPVRNGQHLARTWNMPTINQPLPPDFVLPRFGVYAARITVDGKLYGGVTNIGVRPTVGADGPLAETWIDGFCGNLYGKTVPVELLHFIRPEHKFPSLEALRRQMEKDAAVARQYR